ncbi:MAG TPA: hypothetical protein VJ843_03235 [Candidatus Saccharimonadales bacterium]|nr:hypothetical protein [Candidatus Saccharimonadales bacterium]
MIGFPEIILLIGLVVALVFEVATLVILWRRAATINKKILWTVLMIMFNPMAAVIYVLAFVKNQMPHNSQPTSPNIYNSS